MDFDYEGAKKAGYTDEEINSFVQKKGLTPIQKVAKVAGEVAPVAGGILGSLIGAGATLPTVAGVPLGAAAGAAAGTGAGLALGESLKNLTGVQEKSQAQLAKESVLRPVVAGATDFAAGQVMQNVIKPVGIAVKGGAEGIFRSFVPKNASTKAFASIFKTNYKLTEKLKPQEVADEMIKHGVHGDLDDLRTVANAVTGPEGVISKITRSAVGSVADEVPVSGAVSAAKQAGDMATNVDKKVLSKIVTQISDIISGGKQVGRMNPLDALESERTLEKIGYDLLEKAANKGGMDELILQQQAEMYLSAAEEIGKQINGKVVGQSVLETMKQSPTLLSSLESISPRLKDQFLAAKTLGELRSIAKPFVRLGMLVDKTQAAQGSQFVTSIASGKQGLLGTLTSGFQRPEAATAFAQAGQSLSQSPIGQGAQIVSKGVQNVAELATPTINPAIRGLMQILAQAGITENLSQESQGLQQQ